MGRGISVLMLCAACLVAAPAEADWIFSPFVGVKFGADVEPELLDIERSVEEQSIAWGISVGLLGAGPLGVEADFGWVNSFFEGTEPAGDVVTSSRAVTLMGNVVLAAPTRVIEYGLRPYVIGGVGLIHARSSGPGGVLATSSSLFGLNVGGGAIGPLTERTSLRFDLRRFRSLRGAEGAQSWTKLSFWRATVGLTFRY